MTFCKVTKTPIGVVENLRFSTGLPRRNFVSARNDTLFKFRLPEICK